MPSNIQSRLHRYRQEISAISGIRFDNETFPGHRRPVTIKPVVRIFGIGDSNPTRKMRKDLVPLTPDKQGSEEMPQSKNAEHAEIADTKMQKMRLPGFNVIGIR